MGRETFTHVLVGVDEQSSSDDAIALARGLMAPGGTLTLAHVHGATTTAVQSSTPEILASEARNSLELLQAARVRSGVDAGRVCIGSPSVGRGLHELAEREHADLLVMGSCRRGLIGRVLVGDDTQDALNGAPCAVAVAPAGYAGQPAVVQEIGVGYNGSPESRSALAVARELAHERGARLSAFEAVSLPAYFFTGPASPVGESIDAYVEQARTRIAALGGVEPHAAYGAAAEELTVYSASLDMLVVGSRGYGPIGRMMHGSVSHQLARTARCPLIVLTRADPAQTNADRAESLLAATT